MANQPGTSTGSQSAGSAQGGVGRQSGSQGQSGIETGVRDATYNLISVVYHALQGAETYKMYEEDVERTQDDELAQFFRQAHEDEKRRAQQGKELLARHLQKHAGGGQQLQQGGGGQQGTSGGARSGQQMQGQSSDQQQAVPGDQYGNSQSSSTRR